MRNDGSVDRVSLERSAGKEGVLYCEAVGETRDEVLEMSGGTVDDGGGVEVGEDALVCESGDGDRGELVDDVSKYFEFERRSIYSATSSGPRVGLRAMVAMIS